VTFHPAATSSPSSIINHQSWLCRKGIYAQRKWCYDATVTNDTSIRKAIMFYQNQINSEKPFSDSTRTRLPLPVATGGIGLFIAAASPGGLSGGAGFLIGFIIGLLLPAFITVLSHLSQTKSPTVAPASEGLLVSASETSSPQSLYSK